MWNHRTFTFLLLMVLFVAEPSHGDSPKVRYPDNGHFYQRIDTAMAWDQAKAYCEGRGGYLATATSAEEDGFLLGSLLGPFLTTDSFWLGATDLEAEGVWEWVTGEFWGYSRWHPEALNEFDQTYLAITRLSGASTWYAATVAEAFPFICEWGEVDLGSNPEAPTLQVTYAFDPGDHSLVYNLSWTQAPNANGYYLYADFTNDRPFDGTFDHAWDFGNVTTFQFKYDFSYDLDAYVAVRPYHQTIGPYSNVIRILPVFPSFYSFIYGKTTDALTGTPIEGAAISAPETLGFAVSLPDGTYSMIVDPGTWTVSVAAPGYLPIEKPGVKVGELDAVELDFALLPMEALSSTLSGVDIKANDQDGPLTALSGDPVAIHLLVNPAGRPDEPVDWWLVVNSPFGLFFYSEPSGWVADLQPYKQASASRPEEIILGDLLLPKGSYSFYFAYYFVTPPRSSTILCGGKEA